VLAAVTAILLVAVAIVLWRNGVLPTAAGTDETSTSSDAGASGGTTDGTTTDGTTTDGTTTDGTTGTDGTVVPPPLPGGATDGTTTDGTTTDGTTTDGTANGDLGLAVPISQPACDGSFVVFLGSSTSPAEYQTAIQGLLTQYPGSSYLLTAGSCTSLRQAYTDGNQIYAVYTGPYLSQAEACAALGTSGDPDAYVKVLDNTTPPEQIATC
jgi:serine/threonine-protein kinase